MAEEMRRAEPGELCTCGRQAVEVYDTPRFGPIGACHRQNGGQPEGGWCPFCENELRHDEPRVDDDLNQVGVFLQGRRCPRYRLRLTDPVPTGDLL